MEPIRQLRLALIILTSVLLAGSLGYSIIEGWSFFDALYMTVITLATVGFKEVHELSQEGKAFTIVLIIGGTGVMEFAVEATKLLGLKLEGSVG